MGKRDPALIEGPDLIEREAAVAEYIGSPGFWEHLQAEIEGRRLHWIKRNGEAVLEWGSAGEVKPKHPSPDLLARGIRAAGQSGTPIPREMADYIAGRLDGSIKVPRGNPNKVESAFALHQQRRLAWRVDDVRKLCEADPKYRTEVEREHGGRKEKRGALARALKQVARESEKKEATLKKYHQEHRPKDVFGKKPDQPPREPDPIPAPVDLQREREESRRRQSTRSG